MSLYRLWWFDLEVSSGGGSSPVRIWTSSPSSLSNESISKHVLPRWDSSSAYATSAPLRVTPNGRRVVPADAAPSAGAWLAGDRIDYRTPSSGGYIGSVCTTGGSPGTWKDYGAVT